jgi:phenylpyruvate tautomerase PptA (4-oxalocrotonate tautomerase family)
MPFTQISLRRGKAPVQRRAIAEAVCTALHQTFGVPDDDRFVTVTEHDDADFVYAQSSWGVTRTDNLVFIRIIANRGRTVEQKNALYARIAGLLADDPGIRPEDVYISINEVSKEDWSFGNGIAQLA